MMELLWQLLNWLSPASRAGVPVQMAWVQFIPLIISAVLAAAQAARNRGGKGDNDGAGTAAGIDPELMAELRRMMDLQQQEYLRADPLRQAVLQLAYRMMPTFAREGISGLNLGPLVPGEFGTGGRGGRTTRQAGGVPPAGRRDWTGPGPSDDELSRLAAVRHPRPWEILPGRRPGRFPPRSRRQMP